MSIINSNVLIILKAIAKAAFHTVGFFLPRLRSGHLGFIPNIWLLWDLENWIKIL